MELVRNTKVSFAELPGTDLHKYLLDENGTELAGVTTMMKRLGLSASYSGIHPDVLARAAARGTAIHEMLQQYETEHQTIGTIHYEWNTVDGVTLSQDEDCNKMLNRYAKLISPDFRTIAVEYLVSDDECIASMIDLVSQVDETTVDLIDYKSGSTVDKKGLEWQLSFYKYLFERQNEGIKVRNLIGVHCHNEKVKVIGVQYKGDEIVAEKIALFKSGADVPLDEEHTVLALDTLLPEYPKFFVALEQKRQMQAMIDRIDDEYAGAMELLKERMREQHLTEVAVPGGKYLYSAEHLTTRFDSKRFKADHPDEYDKYTIQSSVAASVKFMKAK